MRQDPVGVKRRARRLVAILPGLSRWPTRDRPALADVVRAKGGRRESDFVQRANAHAKLHRALIRLASD